MENYKIKEKISKMVDNFFSDIMFTQGHGLTLNPDGVKSVLKGEILRLYLKSEEEE